MVRRIDRLIEPYAKGPLGPLWDSTLNPSKYTYGMGNRGVTSIASGSNFMARGVVPKTRGKWYFAVLIVSESAASGFIAGVAPSSSPTGSGTYPGADAASYGCQFDRSPVAKFNNAIATNISGTTCGAGDVAKVAVDFEGGGIYFGRNGDWYNGCDPARSISPILTFTAKTTQFYAAMNEGFLAVLQNSITYPPPAGFDWWE